MTHPSASLGHDAFVGAITHIRDNPKTPDEKVLAQIVLDLYRTAMDAPGVRQIIDAVVLRAIERKEP